MKVYIGQTHYYYDSTEIDCVTASLDEAKATYPKITDWKESTTEPKEWYKNYTSSSVCITEYEV